MKFIEYSKRSLIKTITYRIVIIISTLVVAYLLTGNWDLTISITIWANLLNAFLYYLHERIWNKIHWGKTK